VVLDLGALAAHLVDPALLFIHLALLPRVQSGG
jgi:hypothetical protein